MTTSSTKTSHDCKKIYPYMLQFLYFYLFQHVQDRQIPEEIQDLVDEETLGRNFDEFLRSLEGVGELEIELQKSLKVQLFRLLKNWKNLVSLVSPKLSKGNFAQLAPIDQILLVLGAFELQKKGEGIAIPRPLVIDSIIELAKKFSSKNSPALMNGVLDQL